MDSLFILVLLVAAVEGALLLFMLLRCPQRAQEAAAQSAREGGPGLPPPNEHPLACHHRDCTRYGEVFWQNKRGVTVLCRHHAHQLWQELHQLLEAQERD